MVVDFVPWSTSAPARAASEPDVSARRGRRPRTSRAPCRWSWWPKRSGRCWCSVPPNATFSSCIPRQMPSRGISRSTARRRARSRTRRARHRVDGRRVELRAVAGRVDVGAADEHQPVDEVERLVGRLDEHRVGREQQRHPAGAADCVEVVGRDQRRLLVPHAPLRALERGADADDGRRGIARERSRDSRRIVTHPSPSPVVSGRMEESARQFDLDWLVVGSGFGGSVSALRLAEKGYRVGVLKCGRRFRDQDFASPPGACADTSGRRGSGCAGSCGSRPSRTCRRSGCGVGGGSLGYANTLYVPPSQFFQDPHGASSPTGSASWRRTTPRRSACSASSRTRTTIRPTSC